MSRNKRDRERYPVATDMDYPMMPGMGMMPGHGMAMYCYCTPYPMHHCGHGRYPMIPDRGCYHGYQDYDCDQRYRYDYGYGAGIGADYSYMGEFDYSEEYDQYLNYDYPEMPAEEQE